MPDNASQTAVTSLRRPDYGIDAPGVPALFGAAGLACCLIAARPWPGQIPSPPSAPCCWPTPGSTCTPRCAASCASGSGSWTGSDCGATSSCWTWAAGAAWC
ncbi:hypothetical protein ACFQ9X_29135 [Catenulispora yoronensis]